MADTRGGGVVCNDSCGCPSPCPGGMACRKKLRKSWFMDISLQVRTTNINEMMEQVHDKGDDERDRSQAVLVRRALWLQSMHMQQGRSCCRDREVVLQVRDGLHLRHLRLLSADRMSMLLLALLFGS
ncbi:hypothetical protein V6N12_048470 [Hibiscus sabdariffa]|uniref:Uncharacterized protein n=1 Tax=Hibiscus sabdariffa TaxID=183260 RepID=A0ABR2EHC3_9ROSI